MDEINVVLVESEGKNLLRFEIMDISVDIDLNSEEQDSLRTLFNKVLNVVVKEEVTFKLTISENYNNVLFKEIAAEYIEQLNTEVKLIRDKWLSLLENDDNSADK